MKHENNQTSTIYLVTGVAGNLGGSVAAKLVEEGKAVRGLVLKGDPAAAHVSNKVDTCIGDVTDLESLERFFRVDNNEEIEKGRKGEGYILGNECVTIKQMFHLLSTFTGMREVKMILPASAAKLFGKLSDLGEKITGKPARMSSYGVYNLIRNNAFDCSKAKHELNFRTRPFADSIKDIVAWLEHEHKIQTA